MSDLDLAREHYAEELRAVANLQSRLERREHSWRPAESHTHKTLIKFSLNNATVG
jgi:hypothetical protein